MSEKSGPPSGLPDAAVSEALYQLQAAAIALEECNSAGGTIALVNAALGYAKALSPSARAIVLAASKART
jgi:hypothetical protein